VGAYLAAVDTQDPTRLLVEGQRCFTIAGLDNPNRDNMHELLEDLEKQGPEAGIMKVVPDPAPMESLRHGYRSWVIRSEEGIPAPRS